MKLRDLKEVENILTWYVALSYRWEEYDTNPIREDEEYFANLQDAVEYASKLEPELGCYSIVEEVRYEVDIEEDLDIKLQDVALNTSRADIETVWSGDTNDGQDIQGSIIVEWSYEKYIGYARNLLDIGVAGQYPFQNFKTESDLISGNEERTFMSNYSLLVHKDDLQGLTADEMYLAIVEELNSGQWKWNYFKNNPSKFNIDDVVESVTETEDDY